MFFLLTKEGVNFFLFERKKECVLFLYKTRKVPKEICKRSA